MLTVLDNLTTNTLLSIGLKKVGLEKLKFGFLPCLIVVIASFWFQRSLSSFASLLRRRRLLRVSLDLSRLLLL